MTKKQVSYVILYFLLALVALSASVFAWFVITKQSLGVVETNVPNFSEMISFHVRRRGDEEPVLIETISDMHEAFGKTRPGEYYEFTLYIRNGITDEMNVNIFIPEVYSTYINDDDPGNPDLTYSMLDIFYLENGTVYTEVNGVVESHIIAPDSNYFLSNLISSNNSLNLLSNYLIAVGDEVRVTFTITYNSDTSDTSYQYLMLALSGIYVYAER